MTVRLPRTGNRRRVALFAALLAAALTAGALAWRVSSGGSSGLGASDAFVRSLDVECGTSPSIDLWTDLIPLTTITVVDLPGAVATVTHGDVAIVGTRAGHIFTWNDAAVGPVSLLDLSARTSVDSDRGLLGLELSADGSTLLVLRSDENGDTVLTGHRLVQSGAAKRLSVDPGSEVELLVVDQPDPRHNGGGLAVGPGGDLFIGIGDGGGQGDPNDEASDPGSRLGAILRGQLDEDALLLSPVQAAADGRDALVWATGVRNPFRLWFDSADRLWVADVGERCTEEVSVLDVTVAGQDLGWSALEGSNVFAAERGPRPAAVEPVLEWSHDDGSCAAIGGAEYRGDIDELTGAQIVADLCTGTVLAILDGEAGQLPVRLDSPVDVNIGPDGELWITDMAAGVRRITRSPLRTP